MFCPNCGKEARADANFCKHCGAKLILEAQIPKEEAVRNILIRRIEGVKNRNAKAIEGSVWREKYTKFDDWPPFELQGPEALENEAKALKVLKEYEYETRAWKIQIFGESAIVAFTIRYHGQIRDLKFDVRSRVTSFLTISEGEWKIVHEHWSRFPQ